MTIHLKYVIEAFEVLSVPPTIVTFSYLFISDISRPENVANAIEFKFPSESDIKGANFRA